MGTSNPIDEIEEENIKTGDYYANNRCNQRETKPVNILRFRFHELNQLLDESDPRPFPNCEITERAEDSIFGYVDEYGITKKRRTHGRTP